MSQGHEVSDEMLLERLRRQPAIRGRLVALLDVAEDTQRRNSTSAASGSRGSATICTSPAPISVIHAGTDTVDPSGRRIT